jgi:hypothetical protein
MYFRHHPSPCLCRGDTLRTIPGITPPSFRRTPESSTNCLQRWTPAFAGVTQVYKRRAGKNYPRPHARYLPGSNLAFNGSYQRGKEREAALRVSAGILFVLLPSLYYKQSELYFWKLFLCVLCALCGYVYLGRGLGPRCEKPLRADRATSPRQAIPQ